MQSQNANCLPHENKPLIVVIFFAELTPCTMPPHPCNNNGNCIANEQDESVECQCFQGWEGEYCQIGRFEWHITWATVKTGSFY